MATLQPTEERHTDPMDQFSKPREVQRTELASIFYMNVRNSPAKPGRSLLVTHDSRTPLIEGFTCRYSYAVRFDHAGDAAGGHFHRSKEELFVPMVGTFRILLEDPVSKKQEAHSVSALSPQILHIRTGVAHKVIALEPGAVLLVHATAPNLESDEFNYVLTER